MSAKKTKTKVNMKRNDMALKYATVNVTLVPSSMNNSLNVKELANVSLQQTVPEILKPTL